MKKILVACLALAGLSASMGFAEEAKKPVKGVDEPLKVLMIGNSFSICCLWQTPQVSAACGQKLDMASLYIGGCSLERHWQNVEVAQTNATFKPYRYDRITEGNRVADNGKVNIPDALKSDAWDVVTIQQCSHKSWVPESYHPFGDNLVKTIRELAPQAKILVQETWSYPPWDPRLDRFARETGIHGFDHVEMYTRLRNAYADFARGYGFEIIPMGAAAEFCPERNRLFTAPDFHLNKTEGEYLQGLVWTAKLFGADVTTCSYAPQGMDATRAQDLKNVAMKAIRGEFTGVTRTFREPRLSRDDTNLVKIQPIDNASWIWHKDDLDLAAGAGAISHDAQVDKAASKVMAFEKSFEVKSGEGTFTIDVSADERFYLTLDGQFVARGPNRADVPNWQYQTYQIDVKPGTHVLKAVVTRLGNHAPLAQLSHRGGFILKASGAFDERLTTGKAKWSVGTYSGMHPAGADNGVWGTGSQFEIVGRGPFAVTAENPAEAVVVRGPVPQKSHKCWGSREPGWMLYPSQLPDQLETKVTPGHIVAATHEAPWRGRHDYTEADTKAPEVAAFEALLKDGKVVTIPARTKLQLAWNLGRYICAYPVLKTKDGKGARVSWTWTESARDAKTNAKANRQEIVGKYLQGYGETFRPDGADGEFSSPWFRCGLWCRLDIETGDEPLALTELSMIENRYPVEMESAFTCADASLQDIRRICTRAMQMCCHEMLFDCPYYEQQMYPGDTRVQLLVLSALSRDDRIIKRAMEIYDLATRDDGQCPFNFPTRGTQEGFTYTLCYLAMYGDYAMNHADRAWLKARLPGLRKSMAGCELYENKQGLVEKTPGWNFMDWTTEWHDSAVPRSENGHALNSFVNLFWLLDMQSSAKAERALGNDLQAQYWEAKAAKLKAQIVTTFWNEERGLIADTPICKDANGKIQHNTYSEHQQALAVITDCLPKDKAETCFQHLIADKDLARTTVYFNYYLFEAYFKMGRADLFLKRLDLWRDYVKMGVTTLLEAPDSGKNGQDEARSDCHAWGSHPIWFMQTGLAGIKSDAPFFQKVRIAPCPGDLKDLQASHPHPNGWIKVDLKFADGKATGTVDTPVPGTFVFGDQKVELKKGLNTL